MKKMVIQYNFNNGSNIQEGIVIGSADVNKIKRKHVASVF
jgi:hypothetical protein